MTSVAAAPFGRLLRQHRLAAGLSQEALAERAGLSARGIRALERGERSLPRPHTLRLLADGLGLAEVERAKFHVAALPKIPDDRAALRLPIPPTPLIGREEEATRVRAMLGRTEVRLVSLIGTGAVGKTRLALQVAAEIGDLTCAACGGAGQPCCVSGGVLTCEPDLICQGAGQDAACGAS